MKHALILVACLCTFPSVAVGATGVFSSRLATDEMQAESEESLSSRLDAHQGMYAIFTGNAMTVPLAVSQSRLQALRAGVYDQVSAWTLRVRGNAGETLMSHFYVAEGWSQVPGQTGAQGIDGLFVKRGPGGGIVKFQVVDSKVGGSTLQKTKNGWQLSPEWTRNNLAKCLRAAERAYAKSPSSELAGQIADYKQMLSMMDRGYLPSARIYHAAIRANAKTGRVELVMENEKVDFASDGSSYTTKPSGRPMRVDMQTPDAQMSKRMLNARNKWYDQIEENLTKSKSKVPRWLSKRIVSSLKKSIQDGVITSSKDANKFIRDKLAVYEKAVNYSKVGGLALAAGVIQGVSVVAHDWVMDSVDSSTWTSAGAAAAGGSAAAAGMAAAQTGLTKLIANQVATYQVKHSTEAATQKLVTLAAEKGASNAVKKKLESKIASKTAELLKSGKIGGGVAAAVGGGFGIYEIGSSYYKLRRGEISKQDAVVYGSLGGANILGAVAAWAWGGPVAWAVGGCTLVIGGGYSLYQEHVLARRMALEGDDRARYNTERRRQLLQKYLSELEAGAVDDERLGWSAIERSLPEK